MKEEITLSYHQIKIDSSELGLGNQLYYGLISLKNNRKNRKRIILTYRKGIHDSKFSFNLKIKVSHRVAGNMIIRCNKLHAKRKDPIKRYQIDWTLRIGLQQPELATINL